MGLAEPVHPQAVASQPESQTGPLNGHVSSKSEAAPVTGSEDVTKKHEIPTFDPEAYQNEQSLSGLFEPEESEDDLLELNPDLLDSIEDDEIFDDVPAVEPESGLSDSAVAFGDDMLESKKPEEIDIFSILDLQLEKEETPPEAPRHLSEEQLTRTDWVSELVPETDELPTMADMLPEPTPVDPGVQESGEAERRGVLDMLFGDTGALDSDDLNDEGESLASISDLILDSEADAEADTLRGDEVSSDGDMDDLAMDGWLTDVMSDMSADDESEAAVDSFITDEPAAEATEELPDWLNLYDDAGLEEPETAESSNANEAEQIFAEAAVDPTADPIIQEDEQDEADVIFDFFDLEKDHEVVPEPEAVTQPAADLLDSDLFDQLELESDNSLTWLTDEIDEPAEAESQSAGIGETTGPLDAAQLFDHEPASESEPEPVPHNQTRDLSEAEMPLQADVNEDEFDAAIENIDLTLDDESDGAVQADLPNWIKQMAPESVKETVIVPDEDNFQMDDDALTDIIAAMEAEMAGDGPSELADESLIEDVDVADLEQRALAEESADSETPVFAVDDDELDADDANLETIIGPHTRLLPPEFDPKAPDLADPDAINYIQSDPDFDAEAHDETMRMTPSEVLAQKEELDIANIVETPAESGEIPNLSVAADDGDLPTWLGGEEEAASTTDLPDWLQKPQTEPLDPSKLGFLKANIEEVKSLSADELEQNPADELDEMIAQNAVEATEAVHDVDAPEADDLARFKLDDVFDSDPRMSLEDLGASIVSETEAANQSDDEAFDWLSPELDDLEADDDLAELGFAEMLEAPAEEAPTEEVVDADAEESLADLFETDPPELAEVDGDDQQMLDLLNADLDEDNLDDVAGLFDTGALSELEPSAKIEDAIVEQLDASEASEINDLAQFDWSDLSDEFTSETDVKELESGFFEEDVETADDAIFAEIEQPEPDMPDGDAAGSGFDWLGETESSAAEVREVIDEPATTGDLFDSLLDEDDDVEPAEEAVPAAFDWLGETDKAADEVAETVVEPEKTTGELFGSLFEDVDAELESEEEAVSEFDWLGESQPDVADEASKHAEETVVPADLDTGDNLSGEHVIEDAPLESFTALPNIDDLDLGLNDGLTVADDLELEAILDGTAESDPVADLPFEPLVEFEDETDIFSAVRDTPPVGEAISAESLSEFNLQIDDNSDADLLSDDDFLSRLSEDEEDAEMPDWADELDAPAPAKVDEPLSGRSPLFGLDDLVDVAPVIANPVRDLKNLHAPQMMEPVAHRKRAHLAAQAAGTVPMSDPTQPVVVPKARQKYQPRFNPTQFDGRANVEKKKRSRRVGFLVVAVVVGLMVAIGLAIPYVIDLFAG